MSRLKCLLAAIACSLVLLATCAPAEAHGGRGFAPLRPLGFRPGFRAAGFVPFGVPVHGHVGGFQTFGFRRGVPLRTFGAFGLPVRVVGFDDFGNPILSH